MSKIQGPGSDYTIEVKFDRSNATYKPQQLVTGTVGLVSKSGRPFQQQLLQLQMAASGTVAIQNRNNRPEIQDIRRKVPPIRMLNIPPMLLDPIIPRSNTTKLPFSFKLSKSDQSFLQSYIGVYVNISYSTLTRVTFQDKSTLQEETPFYLQVPKAGREAIEEFIYPKKKSFVFSTEDIKGDKTKVPSFRLKGQIESEICCISDDLEGQIVVDLADSPIRSVDLQMLRVEGIQWQGRVISQKTQIQLIQICDGNVTRNLQIPIYMILPRYYSCPSVRRQWCKIDFEVNLQLIFKDGYKVSANIPLKLIRS